MLTAEAYVLIVKKEKKWWVRQAVVFGFYKLFTAFIGAFLTKACLLYGKGNIAIRSNTVYIYI